MLGAGTAAMEASRRVNVCSVSTMAFGSWPVSRVMHTSVYGYHATQTLRPRALDSVDGLA